MLRVLSIRHIERNEEEEEEEEEMMDRSIPQCVKSNWCIVGRIGLHFRQNVKQFIL